MTNPQQPAQPVNVHIQTGAGEIIRIVGTLLAFGGIGVLAWVVAQQGYAEKVATVLAAAVAFIATRLWSRGILAIPASGEPANGDADADFLRQVGKSATAVSGGYLSRCSVPMLSLIGLAYGLLFLGLRTAITLALNVFQNMFVAGGFALLLGSLVVAPSLFPNFMASLRQKGVVRPEGAPSAAPVYTPPTAPQPYGPAPQPTYPQPPVAPAPAPTTRRVVRRVVKKETPDA